MIRNIGDKPTGEYGWENWFEIKFLSIDIFENFKNMFRSKKHTIIHLVVDFNIEYGELYMNIRYVTNYDSVTNIILSTLEEQNSSDFLLLHRWCSTIMVGSTHKKEYVDDEYLEDFISITTNMAIDMMDGVDGYQALGLRKHLESIVINALHGLDSFTEILDTLTIIPNTSIIDMFSDMTAPSGNNFKTQLSDISDVDLIKIFNITPSL